MQIGNYSNNFADQVQIVDNITRTQCVQVVSLKRHPSVVFFTSDQILDMTCFRPQTVLGFDKTFNLGNLYVTAGVFKNLSVSNLEKK